MAIPAHERAVMQGCVYVRIQAGDYRIIHTVEDATRTVLIAAIGHRWGVYRRTSS